MIQKNRRIKDLVSTAGAETVGMVIQNENSNIREPMSERRIEELKSMIWELRATGITCDDELSTDEESAGRTGCKSNGQNIDHSGSLRQEHLQVKARFR